VFAGEAVISWLTEETFDESSVGSCNPAEAEMLDPNRTDTRARYKEDLNSVFMSARSFTWKLIPA
jgi:hypothetical protein